MWRISCREDTEVRLCVYRGDKLAADCHIHLSEAGLKDFDPTVCCVTLRRKHPVVEAVEPGDRFQVLFCPAWSISHGLEDPWEASVCVVYDEGGHLLSEVNLELFSEVESQKLEAQFGELVLKSKNSSESRRKRGVCRNLGFTFPIKKEVQI